VHLRIGGEKLPVGVLEEFAAITDRSLLRPEAVQFNDAEASIVVPLSRPPLRGKRRRLLVSGYRRDQSSSLIRAVLTIRNVESWAAECAPGFGHEPVTLLFGVGVKGNEVYFESAEEDQGRPWYSLTAKVTCIDLELDDIATVAGSTSAPVPTIDVDVASSDTR
jgi:hypothetical protein